MRQMALKHQLEVPELYGEPSNQRASHFILSTSCLFGERFAEFCFAPVVEDGFGLGYGYSKDGLGFVCSSFAGNRDGGQFTDSFIDSMDKMHSVLEGK